MFESLSPHSPLHLPCKWLLTSLRIREWLERGLGLFSRREGLSRVQNLENQLQVRLLNPLAKQSSLPQKLFLPPWEKEAKVKKSHTRETKKGDQ